MITDRKASTPGWLVVMVVAVLPWVVAWLVTLAEWAVLGGGADSVQQVAHALSTPFNLLVPVLVYAACLGINQFLRKGLTLASPHQRWTAGGWFAAAALAVVIVTALPWGGIEAMAYQAFWAIFSGYGVLVLLAGAYTWRSNDTPYPPLNDLQDADR